MELQGFYGHDTDNSSIKKEHSIEAEPLSTDGGLFSSPALKRPRLLGPPGPGAPLGMGSPGAPQLHHGLGPAPGHVTHAPLMGHPGHPGANQPPLSERVMLYVRQEPEAVFNPLHVIPPTTQGLLEAIEIKYKISPSSISNLYRKNKKGITVKIDDEMVKHYCNEDLFIIEIKQDSHTEEDELYEVTLIELPNP